MSARQRAKRPDRITYVEERQRRHDQKRREGQRRGTGIGASGDGQRPDPAAPQVVGLGTFVKGGGPERRGGGPESGPVGTGNGRTLRPRWWWGTGAHKGGGPEPVGLFSESVGRFFVDGWVVDRLVSVWTV